MTHEDYDAYEEHLDMHANIELLNGNTFRCPLCSIVTIGSFQQWKSHKAAHRQAYDHCQTPTRKKAKLGKLNTDTSSLLNINRSQVPGPSNESSMQIGHGASPVEQSQLHYSFEKVGEKTFKNGVIDRHYRANFDPDQSLDGENLASMYQELENMFDDVIDQARSNLDGNDLGRIVIHHPKLTNDIYVPLRKLDDLSGHGVLEHIQNVMTSHQAMDMTDSFHVDVGTMELPKGGAGVAGGGGGKITHHVISG